MLRRTGVVYQLLNRSLMTVRTPVVGGREQVGGDADRLINQGLRHASWAARRTVSRPWQIRRDQDERFTDRDTYSLHQDRRILNESHE